MKALRVLVACEFSGTVRDAFIRAGHYAVSCDLLPSESDLWEAPHLTCDVFHAIEQEGPWDLIIVHPPCTHLAVSGNRWYAGTELRQKAIEWTGRLWKAMFRAAPRFALENPVGALSTAYRPPDQYIQPWQFGHPETKKTGLWLEGLPKLEPTHEKPAQIAERIWRMAPSPNRAKERSRFYPGIARAMADQWSTPQ